MVEKGTGRPCKYSSFFQRYSVSLDVCGSVLDTCNTVKARFLSCTKAVSTRNRTAWSVDYFTIQPNSSPSKVCQNLSHYFLISCVKVEISCILNHNKSTEKCLLRSSRCIVHLLSASPNTMFGCVASMYISPSNRCNSNCTTWPHSSSCRCYICGILE